MPGGWLYNMANRPNGTLHLGVTGYLPRRAWERRTGISEGFTKRYCLKRLVYAEHRENIRSAIRWEKTLKHWPRAWKVRLIHAWADLYDQLKAWARAPPETECRLPRRTHGCADQVRA